MTDPRLPNPPDTKILVLAVLGRVPRTKCCRRDRLPDSTYLPVRGPHAAGAQCVYRHLLCVLREHLKRVMRAARDAYALEACHACCTYPPAPGSAHPPANPLGSRNFRTIRATSSVFSVANHRRNCGVPRTRRLCTLVPGVMIGCPLSGSQRLSFYESQLGCAFSCLP
ncbi:hypothetical protein BDZ89DRAFT_1078958 [Hymenopellis radicata]|nr:hypothetical protein BDZ89DRAFT_1078958 [Hymenopellis radicata]